MARTRPAPRRAALAPFRTALRQREQEKEQHQQSNRLQQVPFRAQMSQYWPAEGRSKLRFARDQATRATARRNEPQSTVPLGARRVRSGKERRRKTRTQANQDFVHVRELGERCCAVYPERRHIDGARLIDSMSAVQKALSDASKTRGGSRRFTYLNCVCPGRKSGPGRDRTFDRGIMSPLL